MDVALLSGEGYKEVNVGETYGIGLSALSERKSQALSQRGEVLYGEVCVRPEELPSWTTWSRSEKVLGLRNSASGKTESEKDVWDSGKPVP
jgi:hypothetical protein